MEIDSNNVPIYSAPVQSSPSGAGTVQDSGHSTCNDDVNNSGTLPDAAHVFDDVISAGTLPGTAHIFVDGLLCKPSGIKKSD